MSEAERRQYDREFKLAAVRQVTTEGRSVKDVAGSLGIGCNLLYRWRKEFQNEGVVAFPGTGRQTPEREELTRVKRELAQAKQDILILKKAAAYFAKHGK